jgi:hypothetical protein
MQDSMQAKHAPRPHLTRLASLICSVLAISLLCAAEIPGPAAASPRPPALISTPRAPRVEVEELQEGEEEGEELEEEEEEEEEEAEASSLAPAACTLRSAQVRIVVSPPRDTVSLSARYTSYAPSPLILDYWLKGSRGALQLGQANEHLTDAGVIHQSQHLSESAMQKVAAARDFIVHFEIPGAPAYCSHYAIQRLSVHSESGGQSSWLAAAPHAAEDP